MKTIRKVIWSNIDIDMDDFEEFWLNNEYDKLYPEYTDVDKYDWAINDNDSVMKDIALECKTPRIDNGILMIEDNPEYPSIRVIGFTLWDCLYAVKERRAEFYIMGGDFKAKTLRDDGTLRTYTYREWRKDITPDEHSAFLEHLYRGTVTPEEMDKCTKSLATLANVIWQNHGFYMDGHRFVYEDISGYSHNFVYSDDGTVIPFSSDMIA